MHKPFWQVPPQPRIRFPSLRWVLQKVLIMHIAKAIADKPSVNVDAQCHLGADRRISLLTILFIVKLTTHLEYGQKRAAIFQENRVFRSKE